MKFNFDSKVNNFLKIILKNAQRQKIRVFFVGGIVRDNILNVETKDIDLLVLGNAVEFLKCFQKEIVIKSVHKDFMTVKVQYEDIEIDIASTRTEKYPYSGCLPLVDKVGVEISKDVLRRDFSVNSLYCELIYKDNKIQYELIDLVDGVKDIQNKTLKVLHDRSYIDDPTRIIRGLGLKYRFGFDFSNSDKKLISDYLSNIDYENQSHDRILSVFKKVLLNKFQDEIFREIIEKKYYKIISDNELDVDFERVYSVFKVFDFDIFQKHLFYFLVLKNEQVLNIQNKTYLDIYKTFLKFDEVDLAYYYYKALDSDVLIFNKIKNIKLLINGTDLINLGYKEGCLMGKILNSLLCEKLKNPLNFKDKNSEIAWVIKVFPLK